MKRRILAVVIAALIGGCSDHDEATPSTGADEFLGGSPEETDTGSSGSPEPSSPVLTAIISGFNGSPDFSVAFVDLNDGTIQREENYPVSANPTIPNLVTRLNTTQIISDAYIQVSNLELRYKSLDGTQDKLLAANQCNAVYWPRLDGPGRLGVIITDEPNVNALYNPCSDPINSKILDLETGESQLIGNYAWAWRPLSHKRNGRLMGFVSNQEGALMLSDISGALSVEIGRSDARNAVDRTYSPVVLHADDTQLIVKVENRLFIVPTQEVFDSIISGVRTIDLAPVGERGVSVIAGDEHIFFTTNYSTVKRLEISSGRIQTIFVNAGADPDASDMVYLVRQLGANLILERPTNIAGAYETLMIPVEPGSDTPSASYPGVLVGEGGGFVAEGFYYVTGRIEGGCASYVVNAEGRIVNTIPGSVVYSVPSSDLRRADRYPIAGLAESFNETCRLTQSPTLYRLEPTGLGAELGTIEGEVGGISVGPLENGLGVARVHSGGIDTKLYRISIDGSKPLIRIAESLNYSDYTF